MSVYVEKATMSLHKMVNEMYQKNIELARVIKCATQLLMTGISPNSIDPIIIKKCVDSQHSDGGWVSVVDTIWNTKFLTFYLGYEKNVEMGLKYLNMNRVEKGFGRSKRDIGRIPVTGLAFYLLPKLSNDESLTWLENLWISERNGLTYKAAYTLMAFKKNMYKTKNPEVIKNILEWIVSQQEEDGGFSPWKNHPVGTNIYCTSLALLGILQYIKYYPQYRENVKKAYMFICNTQLINGIWPYHELEDGGAWGLAALNAFERELNL